MDLPLTPDLGTARPLGEQERMLHYLHNLGALIATHVLHVRGPLDEALMRRGLDWLQRRHGMLGAHIEFRGLGVRNLVPYFYRKVWWVKQGTTEIPLRFVDGDWREVMQQEVRKRLPGGKSPRMRVTVVRESADHHHIISTADHALGDAQAALMSVRELMGFLADPDNAPLSNDARLPPAMESSHTPSTNPKRPYEPAIRLPVRTIWRNKRRTVFEKRVLSVDETTALNAAVKAKRATLHGAVSAAVLQAAGRHFGLDRMTTLSNAEFRRLMKPPLPNETYGCYIDVLRTTHELNKPFWSVASDVAFKLVTAIARHQHDVSALKQPDWGFYRAEMGGLFATDGGFDAFAITSGGDTRFETEYGPFRFEGLDVLISLVPTGAAVYVLALETQGHLELTFCYAARRIDGPDAIAILEAAVATLRAPPAD